MATLQLRSLPDDIHRRLAERARFENTTMSDYVLGLLREDLDLPTPAQWAARVEASWPAGLRVDVDMGAALADTRPQREAP
jgi:plasmid stability protein